MSDLQRTRVHCFLLEENFPFHLLVGCSGRLEQLGHQRVIARHSRSDPFRRKAKKSPSKPSQPALPRSSGSMRIVGARQFFESRRAGEDSSRPIQSFATGQCSRIAESPPRCPSPRRRIAARRRTTIVQRRGRENKRRSISHDRGPVTMPQANAAVIAGGRQPHGTLCSLTRVSI